MDAVYGWRRRGLFTGLREKSIAVERSSKNHGNLTVRALPRENCLQTIPNLRPGRKIRPKPDLSANAAVDSPLAAWTVPRSMP